MNYRPTERNFEADDIGAELERELQVKSSSELMELMDSLHVIMQYVRQFGNQSPAI